ncbi:MAG: formate dehydrogenase subunit delta [Ornithinimicrobium sp.]
MTDRSSLPPEIRMGSDVTRALAHLPPDEASEQIATHLRKFWEPRMRQALIDRVRTQDERVEPLLASAVHDYLDGDIDREEVSEPSGG